MERELFHNNAQWMKSWFYTIFKLLLITVLQEETRQQKNKKYIVRDWLAKFTK